MITNNTPSVPNSITIYRARQVIYDQWIDDMIDDSE